MFLELCICEILEHNVVWRHQRHASTTEQSIKLVCKYHTSHIESHRAYYKTSQLWTHNLSKPTLKHLTCSTSLVGPWLARIPPSPLPFLRSAGYTRKYIQNKHLSCWSDNEKGTAPTFINTTSAQRPQIVTKRWRVDQATAQQTQSVELIVF